MRKPHRPLTGNDLLHQKKALAILIGLPLLAFFLLLPAIRRGRTFPTNSSGTLPFSGDLRLPKLAYLISSTRGEGRRVKRLLRAVYHPWNYYLLHVDHAASPEERQDLKDYAESESVFVKFENVRVVENGEVVTLRGPTMMSSMLHAAAILLREVKDWNWFINLDAADYPLMPQDGTSFEILMMCCGAIVLSEKAKPNANLGILKLMYSNQIDKYFHIEAKTLRKETII